MRARDRAFLGPASWSRLRRGVLVAGLCVCAGGAPPRSPRIWTYEKPPTTTPVARAYAVLRTTPLFSSTHVGAAGFPSREAHAFQVLLTAEDPAAQFRRLLEEATSPGNSTRCADST